MGTAPNVRQSPAMPDPYTLASRSFRLLQRLGLDKESSWALIAQVARTARFRAAGGPPGTDQWLSRIVNYAEEQALSCTPSNTEQQGDDNANR